ncbi:TIGR04222 domain-containing membrane protein [Vandammella animalimorsus]|uniref:TIGR04222 domain-containing membrane protein n=1 Tax=Vandammella animalimorsus TaxID=2029117 RepID=UPI00325B1693
MNDHTKAQAGPADALWQRLQHWRPQDEGFARHLELRLRQRHGWDAAYAARAVQEYRRFMWLLVTHQGAQCPSEAVDAVWHEHLLDSQTYFEQFCPQVLQTTMHHVPNRGGACESQRHRGNYARTLQAYAQAFGAAPPPDIWPAPAQRWHPAAAAAQRPHWRVPKPRWWPARGQPRQQQEYKRSGGWSGWAGGWSGRAAWALGLAAWMAGCAQLTAAQPQQRMSGPLFLLLYGLAMLVLLWYARHLHWRLRPARHKALPVRAPQLYELAFLAGGPYRVAHTVAAELWQAGHVHWHEGAWRRGAALVAPDALQRKVDAALLNGESGAQTVLQLKPEILDLQQRLWQQGWLQAPQRRQWYRPWDAKLLALGYAALALVGALRVISGWQLQRPVGFLLALLLLLLVAPLLWWRHLRPSRLTLEGQAVLQAQRERLAQLERSDDPKQARQAHLPWALALLGGVALEGMAAAAPLQGAFMQPPAAQGGQGGAGCGGIAGSGSSGSDGGGCGGGCGGCGG